MPREEYRRNLADVLDELCGGLLWEVESGAGTLQQERDYEAIAAFIEDTMV